MVFPVLKKLVKWFILGSVAISLIQYWLNTKEYIFSEEAVASIAKKHLGKDVEKSYVQIYNEFRNKYPGHILPESDLQWIFVNAGGWMGSMCLIHASLTEYVLFFGTAVNTVGHSGRYWANITDTLLTGTFRQWEEGTLKVHSYKSGDTIRHVWGEATSVNFAAGTWMVEYGRGFIPSTMGFALSDTLFSTQDFLTMYYTFRIYARAMMLEADVYLAQAREFLLEQFS